MFCHAGPSSLAFRQDFKFSQIFLSPHTPVGRVRLACFARVRLLRHALPIPLLILRKKPTVLQSTYKLAPHHTNVCKFSQLSAAISSFVFNKSLLNTAIFLIFSRVDRFSLSYSCQKLKKQRKDLFTSIFEYQGN